MKCLINPLSGKDSLLHKELYKFFGGDEERANKVYNLVLSDSFKEAFGDWTNPVSAKQMASRLMESREPELKENSLGARYFELEDGTRYFINRQLINYSYKQRKALISSSLIYLMGNDIMGGGDITNIDFANLYKAENAEGVANDAYYIFGGNTESLSELENEIRNYTGNLAYKPEEREDYAEEENVPVDEVDSNRVLDLRSSEEKNSKDNATANIKFLLSYIPKFKDNGELETETITTPDGEDIDLPVFFDYNEVWNMFEETLSGMYPEVNNKFVVDLFEKMRSTMHNKFNTNPSITFLTHPTEGMLANLPEWKQNQFVQAFLKNKVAFYTTTIDTTGGGLKMSFFNSGDVTSRQKKVRNELIDSIQYRSGIFNTRDGSRNVERAKKINDKLSTRLTSLLKKKDEATITDAGIALQNTFQDLGIDVNDEAVISFIESMPGDTESVRAAKSLEKIQYLTKKLASTKTNFFNKNKEIDRKQIEEGSLDTLAEFEKNFRPDVAENTVLGADNKKYWTFSLPNYLNVKLQEYKDNLEEKSKLGGFYTNSVLVKQFKADPSALEDFKILTFLNLRKDAGDVGVDNKTISQTDQFIDMLNKAVLKNRPRQEGRAEDKYSIFNTLSPADKGKMQSLQSSFVVDTAATLRDITIEGQAIPSEQEYIFSEETLKVYRGYFKDEVYRIRDAYKKLKKYQNASEKEKEALKKELYQNYHYKGGNLTTTVKHGTFKGEEVPVGNAFKFQLFDFLNIDLTQDNAQAIKEVEQRLGQDSVRKLFNTADGGMLLEPRGEMLELISEGKLDNFIRRELNKMLDKTFRGLAEKDVITLTENKDLKNKHTGEQAITSINARDIVDNAIMDYYKNTSENNSQAYLRFMSDSLINQHIHNIEYTKIFTGDYAFYKNFDDFSKRIPATYIDGVMLNLRPGDNANYTMAVIPEVKINTDLYKDKDSKVDTNDAQGYITLGRWKFLMERLNKWTPSYEEAYQRMLDGTSTAEDHKLGAQPLKGVYFNTQNGVPTYVKYSQAVLIPKVTEGSGSIDNLRKEMERQGIDEAVALSGVKVGGVTASDVVDENNQFKSDMGFYKQHLQNKGWRLQQDLSPKGVKDTLIGSQLKKNIIQNMDATKSYNGRLGSEIVNTIDGLYSELSDYYREQLEKDLGIDQDGKIKNKDRFYNLLLEEAKRDANINMVEALTNEFDLDMVVNNSRFQPLIASMVNSRTIRIKSNGASYIQMSSHGWNIADAENAGVKMLVDESELKSPRMNEDKTKVLPGQVFVTHNQIAKYIPNYRELSMSDLNALIEDKLRYIVGYRIPNQDLSSTDALEVVGILPPNMGDTMIPYIDITKKNGSDFDIDKMYAMLPEMEPKYKGNKLEKLEYITEKNSNNTPKILNNKLLENYIHILTSKEKFKNLTSPLDSDVLKDQVNKYHGVSEADSGFDFFNSAYQLQKKFDNAAGKAGTGITSNHLVDHTYTQILNFAADTDIGVGATIQNDNDEEVTVFNSSTDIYGNYEISQVLSWFLTAYVDIAKDPYITRGNHNTVTANLTFMLIRAGVPLSWVNAYVGQPVLKRFAELELTKDSRFIKGKNARATILRELESEIKAKYPQYQKEKTWVDFQEKMEKTNPKLDSLFKVVDKKDANAPNLEAALKNNDPIEQYKIFQVFLKHKKVADQFGSTVSNSKQDVNGAPSSIAKMYLRDARKNNLMFGKASMFTTYSDKFTMYLGTAERNSVDLVRNIYKNNFVSAYNGRILESYANKFRTSANAERNLSEVESMMYSYSVSKNKFFNLDEEEITDMLGADGIQLRVENAKKQFEDNILLNALVPNTKVEAGKTLYFVDMENISNKPTTYKNDLISAWDDLFSQDEELALDLMKYSYITSGFKFGMNSFYEYIPASKYRQYVEPAFIGTERTINEREFEDFLYRHNPELSKKVEFNTKGNVKAGNIDTIVGTNIVGIQVEEDNPEGSIYPYIHKTDDSGKLLYLYKYLGYDSMNNTELYIRSRPLGKKVGNRKIMEPSLGKESMFAENNKLATKGLTPKINEKIKNFLDEFELQVTYEKRYESKGETVTTLLNNEYKDTDNEFKEDPNCN